MTLPLADQAERAILAHMDARGRQYYCDGRAAGIKHMQTKVQKELKQVAVCLAHAHAQIEAAQQAQAAALDASQAAHDAHLASRVAAQAACDQVEQLVTNLYQPTRPWK
jgi:hypothetical protein